ncbi:hypothetical protein Bbelb_215910 [Branchiostoma belcheri]|nr:hypothetical protein Bbelb_215910 [Branchiostoma belcheri]
MAQILAQGSRYSSLTASTLGRFRDGLGPNHCVTAPTRDVKPGSTTPAAAREPGPTRLHKLARTTAQCLASCAGLRAGGSPLKGSTPSRTHSHTCTRLAKLQDTTIRKRRTSLHRNFTANHLLPMTPFGSDVRTGLVELRGGLVRRRWSPAV